MEIDRADSRTPNQLRPFACTRGVLNRAHGSASWSQVRIPSVEVFLCMLRSDAQCQNWFRGVFSGFGVLLGWNFLMCKLFSVIGNTKVLAAVYGPKAGTKKNENPEKASIEVIWKPKTGQIDEFCLKLYVLL